MPHSATPWRDESTVVATVHYSLVQTLLKIKRKIGMRASLPRIRRRFSEISAQHKLTDSRHFFLFFFAAWRISSRYDDVLCFFDSARLASTDYIRKWRRSSAYAPGDIRRAGWISFSAYFRNDFSRFHRHNRFHDRLR